MTTSRRTTAKPSVSVVVPAHRRPAYLAECLASIKAQSLVPDEIIVSQDGQDDAVTMVATEAGVRHVVNERPLGQVGNRNQAFRLATGELVAMIDDDDRLEPGFLETMTRALRENPDCGFCSADHWIIDPLGRILEDESRAASDRFGRNVLLEGAYADVFERELRTQPFALQASLFRRSVLEDVGFIPDHAGMTPDFGLMLALGLEDVRCFYVPQRLAAYRIHTGQQTAIGRIENSAGRMACLSHAASQCPPGLRSLLGRKFRDATIAQAIAFAHAGRRQDALRALGHIFDLGFGAVEVSRLIVLVALMAGVKGREARASGV